MITFCLEPFNFKTLKVVSLGHLFAIIQVVDPWGSIIASCHEGVEVCIANIDLKYLHKVRQDMPVWNHRRYDLYGDVTQVKKEPTHT